MPIVYGNGLNNEKIVEIENKYSISFSKEYIDFLNKNNGLIIRDPEFCNLPYNKVDNGYISFHTLFGLDFINENFDLIGNNDDYLDEISFIDFSFIIGSDPSDNFYVLVNNGNYKGIYYWDRTHLHVEDDLQGYHFEEVDECGNLYKVSDSFGDFLKYIIEFTKNEEN
ncbi:SMI1/KNR4 family protein [Xenorhabdus sp. M]|uniref:SMI1/KNR4 family protein n=1 Tax=Xenorhabdus szentirmaii TaxID=290112 RepID=A0AAW3YX80_9GAMM|nr:SMI1/KNR4 family protein [Xenorhabdus sp. M]MBD2802107.1 SMI1/KNR4 family protein [Xenorhabdus sp. M]